MVSAMSRYWWITLYMQFCRICTWNIGILFQPKYYVHKKPADDSTLILEGIWCSDITTLRLWWFVYDHARSIHVPKILWCDTFQLNILVPSSSSQLTHLAFIYQWIHHDYYSIWFNFTVLPPTSLYQRKQSNIAFIYQMIAVNYIWKHNVFAYPKREHYCFNRFCFEMVRLKLATWYMNTLVAY
jgi:hypothetical protein